MANNYDGERVVQLKHLDSVVARFTSELGETFRSAAINGNTVSFFNTKNASGSAVFSFDLPETLLLNQVGTNIVENFMWSALTYPNSTNPNLDGKTVFVLAVKSDDETNPTVSYSFADATNLVDVSDKLNKVSNAVQGNLPIFGISGAIVDSGVTFASDSDINNMIAEHLGS